MGQSKALNLTKTDYSDDTSLITPRFFSTGVKFDHYSSISKLSSIGILRDADSLMERAKHKFHVEQLEYDNRTFSIFTIASGSIISIGLIAMMLWLSRRAGLISTIITTASKFVSSGSTENPPENVQKQKEHRPQTPYQQRHK